MRRNSHPSGRDVQQVLISHHPYYFEGRVLLPAPILYASTAVQSFEVHILRNRDVGMRFRMPVPLK